jgi:drug/metabolite transporter (DMT)-like permease
MGTLLAIASAIGWGIADLLSRNLARDIGSYRSLFYTQAVGLSTLTAYLIASGALGETALLLGAAPARLLLTLAGICALYVIGSLTLTLSFEKGVLAIVSPIIASYAAITAILCWMDGEAASLAGAAGVGVLITGVVLASISSGHDGERPLEELHRPGRWSGVVYALITAATYGAMLFLLGRTVAPAIGALPSAIAFRVASIFILSGLSRPFAQSIAPPPRRLYRPIWLAGLLDASSFIALVEGARIGPVSVAGAISSMATAVTVFLAWRFLDERLSRLQWGGVGLALAGIVLVNV